MFKKNSDLAKGKAAHSLESNVFWETMQCFRVNLVFKADLRSVTVPINPIGPEGH